MSTEKKHALEAVLFDLDGTLIDTFDTFIFCIKQLSSVANLPPPHLQAFRGAISNGTPGMLEAAFGVTPKDSIFATLKEDFLNIYERNVGHQSKLFEGLLTGLNLLEQQGIPWGIVTNKAERFAAPLVQALSINPHCLVCPDHVSKSKPDPESLLLAAQQLKVHAKNCVYIGDHVRDIVAGRAAQMHTIAAAYGYISPGESAAQWQADYYAATPHKIACILEQHFSRSALD